MDRHPSTIKRHRQSLKRREINRAARSSIRTSVKLVEQADSKEAASEAFKNAVRVLDKSVNKNYFHRNKVARLKSRLTRLITNRFTK